MAIQVSGVNVIDNQRNLNVGVLTATSVDVPPAVTTFSPADGASDVVISSNIVLTYNTTVAAGSGNITIRDGSASGTILETIAVSSGNVSISGGQVTINPSSDFPTGKVLYVVVPAGGFTSTALGSACELLDTYNFTTGPITVSSFSPSDGATSQDANVNIVITFSENITKETNAATKYIRIRSGSASGSILQSIDVSTSAVSVSGTQATINPPSTLAYETDQYIVVDENSFFNSDGDADSGNAVINTYNFSTEPLVPPLGDAFEGGYLICTSGGTAWIVAPCTSEVRRQWFQRGDAQTRAQQVSGCSGWFIPSLSQLQNPGFQCRTYWDCHSGHGNDYWTNTVYSNYFGGLAWYMQMPESHCYHTYMTSPNPIRSFRTVSY